MKKNVHVSVATVFSLVVATLVAACPESQAPATSDAQGDADVVADGAADVPALQRVEPATGTAILHDFTRGSGFYTAPFPSEDMRTSSGGVSLEGFPNPDAIDLVDQMIAVLERDAGGFSLTAPVFMQLTDAPDTANLPDIARSLEPDSPVVLVDVDADSPAYGVRYPIDVDYQADGGPFGTDHLLAALPLQGIVPEPGRRHALVVKRSLNDASGQPLGRNSSLAALVSGDPMPGMGEAAREHYTAAIVALDALAVAAPDAIAGLAVYVTDDPLEHLRLALDAVAAAAAPQVTDITALEVFDDFCVFEGTMQVPEFQHGTLPYETAADGGGWKVVDDAIEQAGTAPSRIVFTVPRIPMPAEGYRTAVMIRTGGGGDRPLVDRGPRAENGGEAITPGTGPALHFAQAGWAGVTWDGPHGGPRNVTNADEQFLMFNVTNAAAMRDNVRQTALEATLIPEILAGVTLDASGCPGASAQARFQTATGTMALFGHSMGGTVAPLALAVADEYGAGLFSGTGGSWIENIVFKEKPLEVKPLAELLIGYGGGREIHRHDPALALLQWAGEPADPPVYGKAIRDGARHVLMMQGMVDRYILPPIANAASLSMGLPLAGEALDESVAEVSVHRKLREVLGFAGLAPAAGYPVSANGEDGTTRMVSQHLEDGIEDGHEVVFQTDGPKVQYRCFLQSWRETGVPVVPAPDASTCPQ